MSQYEDIGPLPLGQGVLQLRACWGAMRQTVVKTAHASCHLVLSFVLQEKLALSIPYKKISHCCLGLFC